MGKAPDGKTSLSYEISETKNGLSFVIGGGEVDTHNSHSPSAPLLLVGSNSTHGGVLQRKSLETHEGYESWVHPEGKCPSPTAGPRPAPRPHPARLECGVPFYVVQLPTTTSGRCTTPPASALAPPGPLTLASPGHLASARPAAAHLVRTVPLAPSRSLSPDPCSVRPFHRSRPPRPPRGHSGPRPAYLGWAPIAASVPRCRAEPAGLGGVFIPATSSLCRRGPPRPAPPLYPSVPVPGLLPPRIRVSHPPRPARPKGRRALDHRPHRALPCVPAPRLPATHQGLPLLLPSSLYFSVPRRVLSLDLAK
jgi:hypothetical protein